MAKTYEPDAAIELYDEVNIDYEHVYGNNQLKIRCIDKIISMLRPGSSQALDVGCGTGVPIAQMLARAGLKVVGIDISPKMVSLAAERVKEGSFIVADLAHWEPDTPFDAVLVMFCHLQMNYATVHAMFYKYACALSPNGLLAVGQCPADYYIQTKAEAAAYDETRTYAERCNIPFWGKPSQDFAMSLVGQRRFLESMGLEIVDEVVDVFRPNNPTFDPEYQQYIIARRPGERPISTPQPLPKEEQS
ncbi:hypothetical protein BAUCODRAFT_35999 [Baudoinia panamericana UAMH 10762]|uniref:Methyltransferase domain-containing protein n=1 Tax=Baudoinia panamericana (strain UAMH 10762) TaxID=717646 RepID=M2MDV7_BAUPA|nr:uncharacterized protein BAUCODRAFT_35999 [Baudoinia panamericana UAMH 10762]EMC94746.1 hypothetical protein BAUCODRAFT_35999 [Baudoinia panamericana UAMH 10762]